MADAEPSEDVQQITFSVKTNEAKYSVTLPIASTVIDLKQKLSSSDFADIPAERQRLIFSGRVLKDTDTLSSANIKDGHTIHLVRGAASNARQTPAAQPASASAASTSAPTSNIPTNIAAGTGNNPLAQLTGARYAGFHGLPNAATFGADGGVGFSHSKRLTICADYVSS
jgi:ubiquilin